MQSSRNTTEFPPGDQLYASLNRKLKKTSANITKRKLNTGEYVMYQGRIVPANVVEEAKAEAVEERQSLTHIAADRPMRHVLFQPLRAGHLGAKRLDSGAWIAWIGSRKSVTATSVETSIRHPMHVMVAVPIRQDSSQEVPKDGQLFSYDAKSGQMLLVVAHGKIGGMVRRSHRSRSQQQAMGNVVLKAK
ncbi:hypothetical protein ABPD32_002639 [Yersinia enterocolitica]|uniref:hypothetical protein n=1 Tax=Yersinia enterocolitica TaxID=630 RepID=UPI0005E11130|nr:hypothetical protein [Yersinia enterocolitica]ELI7920528.1 hypothetical protein [Yersinia enterocolitica]ELI8325045.1 hypothetical protein [Yersinia enterocolitica]ELY5182518.1 hypothetical protein [Yersinia enterocolitica]CFQ78295.1 Uncharacterised protein [Yersinia enterocolitica]CQD56853.1 Uncharacterised protein [Yersinia enterocolitica]